MTRPSRLILPTALIALFTLIGSLGDARAERRQPLEAPQIREVMSKHVPTVRNCYVSHVMDQKGATGTITLELLVRAGGKVAAVDAKLPGIAKRQSQQFSACVASKAKRWRFPKSSYQTLVKYPMMFLHTKTAGAGPTIKSGKGGASGPKEQTAAHK